ncbi:MAG: DUF885 domain-containing protein, partial [Proteobacteria bacterium]|nr:DUF885 domain-containing protein [Pseudomonadota bacterium]
MRTSGNTNRSALLAFLCLVIFGCSQKAQKVEPAQRDVEVVADEYLAAMLQRYPESATYYAISGARHEDLFDNSLEAQSAWELLEDAWLAELDDIGAPTDIGSRDWVTYGILHEELAGSSARRICRSELWQASGFTAWYGDLPFIFDIQPLATPELRDQALQRLGQVAGFIDTEVANLRTGLELGYSAPRLTVATVANEVRTLLADDNPFVGMGIRADDAGFESAVRKIYDEQIAPAIERFAVYMDKEYLPQAREEIALSFNPDGAECYPALVRSFATVSPSADEIHELGLEQIAAIRGEMKVIIDAHFGGGEIEAFLLSLNTDPQYTFRSEEEVLQYAIDSLDAVRDRMPEVFALMPKADVLIKAYPAFRASGSGEYHSSSEDGTRPGIFYLSVTDPERRSRAGQQSFLHHETYPGHHLQGALSLELGDRVHALARYLGNSGFGEGWGLYAERLADEMGLYNGPLDRMGMLSDQGARAARLVIDT